MNLGLRWDYFGVIGTDGNQLSIYNPAVGLVRPSQLYPKDLNNFSPRVSVAYDVFGKGKTVVRAGFGVFYDAFSQDFFTGQLAYNTDNTGPAYNPIGPNPVFITFNLNPALPAGTGPLAGDTIIQPNVPIFEPASVTAGTASSTDAFTVAQNLRTPYVYNYNLNVQQELAPNTVLQVGYVGSAGRKLIHFVDINQPSQTQITRSMSSVGPRPQLHVEFRNALAHRLLVLPRPSVLRRPTRRASSIKSRPARIQTTTPCRFR